MLLSGKTLDSLPEGISKPAYDRQSCGVGIVHLGIGAFHRCHMAVYTDEVLGQSAADWRILGVSLRGATIRDQLNPQDGLYTVVVKDDAGKDCRVIGSVAGVLFAPEDPAKVIAAMASAETRIISLTVTEKGYCHDPATGELNECHPDVIHDLEHPDKPRTAIAYLVAGLLKRQQTDAGPVSILSCDNLPANGATVARIVRRFAELSNPELLDWISNNVSFPGTMVDRIVPAMDADDVVAFALDTGLEDAAVLQTEPFTQWVIEDDFKAGRPDWENAGATMVEDVGFFEEAKLRMLNGSHSALAYLGYLAGCTYVHQAMSIPELRAFVDSLMKDEAATSLNPPEGADLDMYRLELEKRFDNSALLHRNYQIAMDGSQKIPQRLLGTLRHQLKFGGPISACSLAVAAWMRYVMAVDENGKGFEVQDPMAARLKSVSEEIGKNSHLLVEAYLSIGEVFGTDLVKQQRFKSELVKWLDFLLNQGALKTLQVFTQSASKDPGLKGLLQE